MVRRENTLCMVTRVWATECASCSAESAESGEVEGRVVDAREVEGRGVEMDVEAREACMEFRYAADDFRMGLSGVVLLKLGR